MAAPNSFNATRDAMRALLTSSFGRFIGNLWARWQDEKEYEDFAEYIAAMKKNAPDGYTVEKATKRPFTCTLRDKKTGHYFKLSATSRGLTCAYVA